MIINKTSWESYKELLLKKNPNWQHDERDDSYYLFFEEAGVLYTLVLPKSTPPSSDQSDWENNFKARSNYAAGPRSYPFSTSDFQFVGSGTMATATKNTTTNVDFRVDPDVFPLGAYINGGKMITEGAAFGDNIASSIVDVDNVLGYGAGLVVSQYVARWYVDPSGSMDIRTPYAGKIPPGLYIRVTYTSVGTVNDVKVAINYLTHKPL